MHHETKLSWCQPNPWFWELTTHVCQCSLILISVSLPTSISFCVAIGLKVISLLAFFLKKKQQLISLFFFKCEIMTLQVYFGDRGTYAQFYLIEMETYPVIYPVKCSHTDFFCLRYLNLIYSYVNLQVKLFAALGLISCSSATRWTHSLFLSCSWKLSQKRNRAGK